MSMRLAAVDEREDRWAQLTSAAFDPPTPTPLARALRCRSHTWSHKDLQTLTAAEITDEVQKLNVAMKKILGAAPTYFRPPYGSYNRDALFVLAENNFTHVAM